VIAFSALTLLARRQKGRHPAGKKTEWWGVGVVVCLERDADLHMAQMKPLPLTVSCFSKIQIGFTFLVLAHLASPGKRAVKRVCVCVSLTAVFWFIRRVSTVVVTITEVFCCWYTAAWVVTLELVCSACYSAVIKGLSQNTVHIRVTLQYEQMLAVSLMLRAPIKIRIAIHCCNMWRLYSGTAIGMPYV